MSELHLTLFNQLTAEVDGDPVGLQLAGIPRGILAVLAFEGYDGSAVAGDDIGRSCWGERWSKKSDESRRRVFKTALSALRKSILDSGQSPTFVVGDFHALRLDRSVVSIDWADLNGSNEALRDSSIESLREANFRILSDLSAKNVDTSWLGSCRDDIYDAVDAVLDEAAESAFASGQLDQARQLWVERRLIARRRGFKELEHELDRWIRDDKTRRLGETRDRPAPPPLEQSSTESTEPVDVLTWADRIIGSAVFPFKGTTVISGSNRTVEVRRVLRVDGGRIVVDAVSKGEPYEVPLDEIDSEGQTVLAEFKQWWLGGAK